MARAPGPRSGRVRGEAPAAQRRRASSETTARSLLTTVLGEFVLPRDDAVWTATFLEVLGEFGIEEKAARQALARTAADGWIAAQRSGRRTLWSLTDAGRKLLGEGAERIYSFGSRIRPWEGTWLVLLVRVPEAARTLRHRLRTRLSWAGFGSPAPGVWVNPDTRREAEARQILDALGLAAGAMSFTARYAAIGSEQTVVSQAWDLDALGARYAEFIADVERLCPTTGTEVLVAQTRLVHEWRRFPFLDPQLPEQLLPPDWIGRRAAELFHDRHRAWGPEAQRCWDALTGPDQPGR